MGDSYAIKKRSVLGRNATCSIHPHISLFEVGADGVPFEMGTCPECEREYNVQPRLIRGHQHEPNRRLQELRNSNADVPKYELDYDQSGDRQLHVMDTSTFCPRRGMPDDDVSLFTRPVMPRKISSIIHPPEQKETTESASYSTLENPETLKEMEMQIRSLHNKIEAQQKELAEKDARFAILQAERFNLQNDQRQAAKPGHLHSDLSSTSAREMYIEELNVHVTFDLTVSDSSFDAQAVQAAIKEATKAALNEELSKARAVCGVRNTDTMMTRIIATRSVSLSQPEQAPEQAPEMVSQSSSTSSSSKSTMSNTSLPADDGQSGVKTSEQPATSASTPSPPITDSTEAMPQNFVLDPEDTKHSVNSLPLVDGGTHVQTAAPSQYKEITFFPDDSNMQNSKDSSDGEKSDDFVLIDGAAISQKKAEISRSPAVEETPYQEILLQRKNTPVFHQLNTDLPDRYQTENMANMKSPPSSQVHQRTLKHLNTKPTGLRAKKEIDPLAGHGITIKELELSGPTVPEDEDVTLAASQFPDIDSISDSKVSKDQSATETVVAAALADSYGDEGIYTGKIMRKTGLPHGVGRMVYGSTGRTYDGDWKNGRWHGHGRTTFANGDSYEGGYRFDKRHGQGKFSWHDGRVYDGEFYEDERHGQGFYQWADGATYRGEFSKGLRHGNGKYIYADGTIYTGSLVDGLYDGFGECQWPDGRIYVGEWKAGASHGHGIETLPDGSIVHDGIWVNDKPIKR